MTNPYHSPRATLIHRSLTQKGDFRFSRQERPVSRLTSTRESSGHRSGHSCMRVRHRPRKRRAGAGHRLRVVEDPRVRAARGAPEDDFRRGHDAHRPGGAGCRRARGVLRRRRRPHRALRRTGPRRRARRLRARRRRVGCVRAGCGQAGGVRLRPGREGAGAAHGAGDPPPRRSAGAEPCGRRARRRDLPRAGAAAAEGSLRVIARLTGIPVARTADGLVLDVHGVGYLLRVSERAGRKAKEGREVSFDTYLHVREDALQLFGFADPAERQLFEQLLSVSGVGPKVALLIVSGSTPAELRRSIVMGDTTRFLAIPGVGKKTAERVVLELKEKLGLEQVVPEGAPDLVARDALVELGYSAVEAERALAGTDPEAAPEERVRQALKAA